MTKPDTIVVSNRGPLSFRFDAEHNLQPLAGGGGLVSSLRPLLAGADTDDHASLGQHNGIALDVLAHPPGETERRLLGRGGTTAGHHLPAQGRLDRVPVLRQQAARDAAQLERGDGPSSLGPLPLRIE